MRVNQILDHLQVGQAFRRRQHQLRLEKLVQPKKGLISPQLVAHHLVCGSGPVEFDLQIEDLVEQVKRRVALEVSGQQSQSLRRQSQCPVALHQAGTHQCKKPRVLRLDISPMLDRRLMATRGGLDIAENHRCPHRAAIGLERRQRAFTCLRPPRPGQQAGGQLTMKLRDFHLPRTARLRFDLAGSDDRLIPIFFQLVYFKQKNLRGRRIFRAGKFAQRVFRPIEQPDLEIVLAQFEQRVQPIGLVEVGPVHQIGMHADRAIDLATPAKQVAQREMQFDGFRIDLDNLDERVNRLVGLLVE